MNQETQDVMFRMMKTLPFNTMEKMASCTNNNLFTLLTDTWYCLATPEKNPPTFVKQVAEPIFSDGLRRLLLLHIGISNLNQLVQILGLTKQTEIKSEKQALSLLSRWNKEVPSPIRRCALNPYLKPLQKNSLDEKTRTGYMSALIINYLTYRNESASFSQLIQTFEKGLLQYLESLNRHQLDPNNLYYHPTSKQGKIIDLVGEMESATFISECSHPSPFQFPSNRGRRP